MNDYDFLAQELNDALEEIERLGRVNVETSVYLANAHLKLDTYDELGSRTDAIINRLRERVAELEGPLKEATNELNTIRARDGVPYGRDGWKSSVSESYFSDLVDRCHAALTPPAGKEE